MTYAPNRDLLAAINGRFGTVTKAAFAYGHDALGRRTSVVQSGEMFSRYPGSGIVNRWAYNDRSEVTSAQSYFGQNPNDLTAPVPARNLGYAFDHIGSRTTTTQDTVATAYTNNALNQLTARTAPASTWVAGLAPTAATVTVNSQAANRLGEYYSRNVTAASTPLWQSLAASSTLGGASTRYVFLAATPENFTYDLDGNLTDDGRWSYAWDGENRLVKIETSLATSVIATGVPRQRITFAYDYLGRRVRKTVANWNASAYITAVDRKFIYDGWNLIAELALNTSTSTFVLNSTYTWGLDLSKTLQDGGGVGGLLAIKLHAEPGAPVLLPAYDGNGNLAALVNRAGGALLAAYEYDAFGQTIRASGTHADKNNFRFSTKYTDAETGLLYYGRRYYNPTLGRWLGRDPIEEKGGLHLYGFVGNNGVNRWDVLGMRWVTRYRVDPNDPNEGQEAYQVWQADAFIVAADRIDNSGERERLIDAYNDSILTTAYTSASTSTGAPSSGDSSVPDAPNREGLRKQCEGLQQQMIRLQDNFSKYVKGPDGPVPDARKFMDAMKRATVEEALGVVNAFSQMASSGLFNPNSGLAFANIAIGASVDLASISTGGAGVPDTVLSGLQGGASLSLAADSTLKFVGKSGVMTISGAAYANFLGWFGVAYTAAKITVAPIISTHNDYFSQFHTEKQIAHEWETNTAPQLTAVSSAFRAMGCDGILSGKK